MEDVCKRKCVSESKMCVKGNVTVCGMCAKGNVCVECAMWNVTWYGRYV